MRVVGPRHALATLPSSKRLDTHFIGGYVGPRCGLDECGKSRPHWDSIGGPSSPVSQSLYLLRCLGPQFPLPAAANGPIVPVDYERRLWSIGGMMIGREKPKCMDNNLPQ